MTGVTAFYVSSRKPWCVGEGGTGLPCLRQLGLRQRCPQLTNLRKIGCFHGTDLFSNVHPKKRFQVAAAAAIRWVVFLSVQSGQALGFAAHGAVVLVTVK